MRSISRRDYRIGGRFSRYIPAPECFRKPEMNFQGISVAIAGLKGHLFVAAFSILDRTQKAPWTRVVLRYRSWLSGIFQAQLILFALLFAWLLRFNFSLPDRALLLFAAPVLISIRLIAIARGGLLHGWWRYTGIDDAVAIVKATALGSVVFVICMRLALGIAAFPRAIYVLEPLLSLLLLGGVRVFFRIIVEIGREETDTCKKVILIGAGAAAEMTLREIGRSESGYRAVACLDDDRSKTGVKIHGVPVLGAVDDLPQLAPKLGVKDILICVPSATGKQTQRFVDICGRANTRFKTVPSLREILNDRMNVAEFREVRLEDLLGRDPVEMDMKSVCKQIKGQTVLVTGAAGTIGSELCRQLLQHGPGKLLCVDRNETGMFYLDMELSQYKKTAQVISCVTDFGDRGRMKGILSEHTPAVIFHAGAYKHVPIMEMNVYDAVKNNVIALLGLLDIAEESGCPSFVLISSDKAVRPANIMGATKRTGELIVSCRPRRSMRCVSVRFGNVLGSNGSLIPVLQKQLREDRQLTITHPEVTRFFMTTHEAVSLVLQAFSIGKHGDTLVLDMGTPIRILDLAKTLIRLSGRREQDVDIRFTGLRPGEKLFEELTYPAEKIRSTSSPKIKQIRGTPGLWLDLNWRLDRLRVAIAANDPVAIRDKMKEIVPEYASLANGSAESAEVQLTPMSRPELPEFTSPLTVLRW
jgi:FlaA1/EpsC-like NDP-sugar epimerase